MTEYCDLGPLEELFAANYQMKEEELRDIASCCLLGLDSLHSRNIMHGVVSTSSISWLERQAIQSVPYQSGCCETG